MIEDRRQSVQVDGGGGEFRSAKVDGIDRVSRRNSAVGRGIYIHKVGQDFGWRVPVFLDRAGSASGAIWPASTFVLIAAVVAAAAAAEYPMPPPWVSMQGGADLEGIHWLSK